MGGWAGFRSPEFGTYPVHLRFSLDSYQGPSWVGPAIRNRSGWLGAAEVEMETEFDSTREILFACVAEDGQVLGNWIAEALFSMSCGLPTEVDEDPPDELDVALDAAYWDFLGRCDMMHLRMLEEKETEIAARIGRLEARRGEVFQKVETFLTALMARRRRERDNVEFRAFADAKVQEVDQKQAEAEAWHRDQIRTVKAEAEFFEGQVLASLGNHGSFHRLYTVHWTTASNRVRRLTRDDLSGYARPQPVRETAWDSNSYLKPDLLTRSVIPKVRGNREVWERQRQLDLLEDQKHEAAERARELARLGMTPKQVSKPASSRVDWPPLSLTGDFRQRSIQWEMARGWLQGAEFQQKTDLQISRLSREASVFERRQLRQQIARPAANSAGKTHATFPANRQIGDFKPAEPEAERDDLPSRLELALVEALKAELVADDGLKSNVAKPAEAQQTAMAPPETTSAEVGSALHRPGHVIDGDCILLRLDDTGGRQFRIRYTLEGNTNDSRRGVLALSDPRAQAILGKNVGDRVCLEIDGRERFALIEKIVNFDR